MPVVAHPLDGLPNAAESLIVRSFFDALKADARFAMFKPWRLIELVHADQILELAVHTAIVAIPVVRIEDWPAKRETIRPTCEVAFGLEWEQTSEDSKLFGLRLLNLVRIKANEICNTQGGVRNTVVDGSVALNTKLTDSTVDVRPLPMLPNLDKSVRWARSHVTWQTDIDPVTGALVT